MPRTHLRKNTAVNQKNLSEYDIREKLIRPAMERASGDGLLCKASIALAAVGDDQSIGAGMPQTTQAQQAETLVAIAMAPQEAV